MKSFNLPKSVKIVEVGPRDGLQNEKDLVPLEVKVDLVNRLSKAGFQNIEAAAFVSPKWTPQMANSEELMDRINRKPNTVYSALTPNMQGYERAVKSRASEIVIFTAATQAFAKKYQLLHRRIYPTLHPRCKGCKTRWSKTQGKHLLCPWLSLPRPGLKPRSSYSGQTND